MQISIQPIITWPRKMTAGRHYSKFKANYSDTVDLLERELRHLRAHSVAVQLAIRPEDIRIDGQMRANTSPSHPGVILSFTGKHGAVTMPCDRYTHWHCNLRAIALSLEALRAVDRHGVTTSGEQYRGWKQLPSGIPMGPAPMTVEDAERFMRSWAPLGSRVSAEDFDSTFRAVVKRLHPDAGGDSEQWNKLQEAAKVLRQHYGLA